MRSFFISIFLIGFFLIISCGEKRENVNPPPQPLARPTPGEPLPETRSYSSPPLRGIEVSFVTGVRIHLYQTIRGEKTRFNAPVTLFRWDGKNISVPKNYDSPTFNALSGEGSSDVIRLQPGFYRIYETMNEVKYSPQLPFIAEFEVVENQITLVTYDWLRETERVNRLRLGRPANL